MRRPWAWIAVIMLLCRLGGAHAVIPVPAATGYLTDQVGIVEPAEAARIQVMLGKYEVASGHRISVLLVESTPDEALEAFADRVLVTWGMDQPDQGRALLLWSGEGVVLIRPSAALGERLTAEMQGQILSRWVVPAFARGEAGLGLRQGVEQMIAVLDGGAVAEAPVANPEAHAPSPQAAASAQEQAVLDALERELGDGTLAAEPSEPVPAPAAAGSVAFEGVPVWIERLPDDLRRLAAPFAHDLDAGVMGWLREAGREADQLPVVLSGLFLQMRGERVEPPFHGVSEFAVYAWIVTLGLALLLLLSRRAFVPAVFMGAVDTAIFLWLATGFVALSGLLVLVGLLSPLLVPLLRGSDDTERDAPMPVSIPAAPRPTARPVRLPKAPARPTSVAHAAPALPSASGAGRQQIDVLLDRLGRIAQVEARRLRWMHLGVLLALCLVSVPLAVLAVLGTVLFRAYRSGAAYLLADVLVKDRHVRDQLKQQLPQPSADGVPDP